jgi:peptidyl-prolyl cis-trans isomerase C
MTLRALLTLALMLLAAPAWAQAAKPAAPADPVVARINGFDIHRSDIEEAARNLPPQARQQPADKIYEALLNQMVGTTLVAQAARRAKFQDQPDTKRKLALIQDQVLAQLYIDQLIQKDITEAKLKAAYEKYLKTAPPREEVNARHILLTNEADAKAVIDQLKKGADFATLAKEKTTDPAGKTSGGDLGWFTKDQMVPEFADAAFKLKKGEFTETPVKTQFGWHVIKVEDRRVAKPPSFEELKPQLSNQLAREFVAQKMNELKTAAKIELYNGDGSKPGAPAPAGAAPSAKPAPSAKAAPAPNLQGEAAPGQPGVPVLSPATKPKD